MTRARRVAITEGAQAHIAAASAWWAEYRLPGVRRITLSRIRYYLYYRLVDDSIQVLALWHTSRGQGPEL